MPVVDRRPFASTSLNARPIQRTRNGGAGYKAVGESRKSEARARGQKAQYEASKVKAIASIVSTVASAAGSVAKYAEAEQAKADNFDFKVKSTEFGGQQELRYNQSKDGMTGDGNYWRANQLARFDQNAKKFLDSLPKSKQQDGQLLIAKYRAEFENRSFSDMQKYRKVWAFDQTKRVLDNTILPNIGSDPDQNSGLLGKIDQLIDGVDVADEATRNKLRAHAANEVYRRWLQSAGPNASETAKEIINRYRYNPDGMEGVTTDPGKDPRPVTRQSPALNIFKNGSRIPSHAERARIFRKGGVVVNLDTNSSKQGGQTSPMVVIPDEATPAQRQAAQDYAERIASVYRDRFGRTLAPRVVTRSQNKRGRPFTIHTEPYSVKDTKAVQFFSSEEGKRLHGQILRETFGRVPGAQFAIPHNPAKGKYGAHGSGTNEVKLARATLGWMQNNADKQNLGGDSDEKGPPRGNTINEHFVRRLFAEEKNIEAYSIQAERRQEAELAREEREESQNTQRAGIQLLHEGKLTKEWIDNNAGKIPPSRLHEFYRALNGKIARTTDRETYSGLLERINEEPEDVIKEAFRALNNNQLSKTAFDTIYRGAMRSIKNAEKTPSWVGEQRALLKSQLRPSKDATPEERDAYTKSLEHFDAQVERSGDNLDRKELTTWTEGLIKQFKLSKVTEGRRALPMPMLTQSGREGFDIQELDAIRGRTFDAIRDGEMTNEEAAEQWELLNKWQKVFEADGQKIKLGPPKPAGLPFNFTGAATPELTGGETTEAAQAPQTPDASSVVSQAVPPELIQQFAQQIMPGLDLSQIPPEVVQQIVQQAISALAQQAAGGTQ